MRLLHHPLHSDHWGKRSPAGHILPYMLWSPQLEKSFRNTGSIMGLLPFHYSPFTFIIYYLFIVVVLRWSRLVVCRHEDRWHLWLETLGALALVCLLFLFRLVLNPVTCAGQKKLTEKPLFAALAVHRAPASFKLHCCSCIVSPTGNPSRLRAAKSPSNSVPPLYRPVSHLNFYFILLCFFFCKLSSLQVKAMHNDTHKWVCLKVKHILNCSV